MILILLLLTLFSVVIGYYAIKIDKKLGILQIIITLIVTIGTILLCLSKDKFVFGGNNYEFLIQTIMVDKIIESWCLLILFVFLLLLMFINIFKIIKLKRSN